MSLKLQAIGPIPEQTIKAAKAAFPKGNTYMKMRDEMGVFFSDEQFADLFSSRGQPALSAISVGNDNAIRRESD